MFKLHSKFRPTGDQPQAIEKLTKNLKAGIKDQVLLGVTGSGKSVVRKTPVLIKFNGHATVENIGEFIDYIFTNFPNKIKKMNDSEVIFTKNLSEKIDLETYSFNPRTKQMSWQQIKQLIRHKSPKQLFKIYTTCGRNITVTNDHNFFTLRDEKLSLLPTNELRLGDYLPTPLILEGQRKNISSIYLPEYLNQEKLFVILPGFASAYKKYKDFFHQLITPTKRFNILNKDERISFKLYLKLIEKAPVLSRKATIGNYRRDYKFPINLPLTDNFLRLTGYYIAEGHANEKYFIISSGSREIISDFTKALNKLGLKWKRRPKTFDYQISSSLLSEFFATICGENSKTKHLPKLWLQFSKTQLANLLQAYFSADGGVDGLGISCTTASHQLASDIMYALLRFGIIARVRQRIIKIPNKDKFGEYWTIHIWGQKFLRIFQNEIGFSICQKNKSLEKIIKLKGNTNVNVIPVTNWILKMRDTLSLSQREIARQCGINRSYISMIEHGKRMPSREVFKKIIFFLKKYAIKNNRLDIIEEIKNKSSLLNLYWTPIKTIKRNLGKDYVYDFAVKDNETFLAGFGGLFVHNTFTAANVIEKVQKPVLWISHNKTLAAQTYQEFKEFFPKNAIHYFVSYYDYYQPEAYIPQTDTYIEKDAKINEEIDRLRHAATQDLLTRDDIIIVASVSCIYNIGSPEAYQQVSLEIKSGQKIRRKDFLKNLCNLQYQRNDIDLKPGAFRVRGNIIDIYLVTGKEILRVEFFGDEINKISISPPGLNSKFNILNSTFKLYPAHFWVTPQEKLAFSIENIKLELQDQLKKLKREKKLLEAQRLEQRTNYDLEMLKESGWCHGVENYSRHLEFRKPGQAPYTLIEYFPEDFLIFIDESHMTLPQLHGMAKQDRARKETLIEYGFRLPSAIDNRPLTFKEFETRINQVIYISATPAEEERKKTLQQDQGKKYIVEQLIRPTGLLEPSVEIRPTKNQVKDLISEIKKQTAKSQRVLVLTLTKRLAEALSDYLAESGIKTQWLHAEVKTLERPQILKDLREGKYEVLVGINLLREGLDLPEVALVAILDADKEGFLRNETTLIQIMGRTARHQSGQVILYADKITKSMAAAIQEVLRRRKIQEKYNKLHNIVPQPIIKEIREWPFVSKEKVVNSEFWVVRDAKLLEREMKAAAKNLDFERAAEIRDLIKKTK